jgi:hypothetical protein
MKATEMYRAARRHQQEYSDFETAGQLYADLIKAFPESEEAEMAKIQLQILMSTGRVSTVVSPSSTASHREEDPTTAWEPSDCPQPRPEPSHTASPALIDILRRLATEQGLVGAADFDRLVGGQRFSDANGLLESLGAAGLLTGRQVDRCRERFVEHQHETAQRVAQTITASGFLSPRDKDEALRGFEKTLFAQTFLEHLVSAGYLTQIQAVGLIGVGNDAEPEGPAWLKKVPLEKLRAGVLELRSRAVKDPRKAMFIGVGVGGLVLVFFVVLAMGSPPPLRPDCNMNGFGNGTCTFSNTGSRANGGCGYVIAWCGDVLRSRKSSTICSGEVAPRESKQMSFSVPGFDRITPGYKDWRDECGFTWISSDD